MESQQNEDYFYYFAYGSNLLGERVRKSNPSAVYVCNALLPGYALKFAQLKLSTRWCGASATVWEDEGAFVCGVVWKVAKKDSDTLDEQESGYEQLYVDVKILPPYSENAVIANGYAASLSTIRCRTYKILPTENGIKDHQGLVWDKPSPYYKFVILAGAKENKLPLAYQKRLEAIEDNDYSGPIGIQLSIFTNKAG